MTQTPKFSRIHNPQVKKCAGYSKRHDRVRLLEEVKTTKGTIPANTILEGGITRIYNKKVGTLDFTGIAKKRRKGVDVAYLIATQPEWIFV